MALSATAITTVQRVKRCLGITDRDGQLQVPAIDIYYDDSGGAAAATVSVSDTALVLSEDGTIVDTLTLTDVANDTITELVTAINANANWVATALTYGDADSNDLVELAETSVFGFANRQSLQIVDNRRLEILIETVTDEIEQWLGRGIAERAHEDVFHYSRNDPVHEFALDEPDITSIDRLSLEGEVQLRVEYTGSDPRATVEVTDTSIVLHSTSGGTTTENELTFASNGSVSAMATAISAVSGWTATVPSKDSNEPSDQLVREGVRFAKDREVELVAWVDYEDEYVVDYDAGVITLGRSAWPFSLRWIGERLSTRIRVEYDAGFSTVPEDVQDVACQMIESLYQDQGRDSRLISESLGGYSYSLSSPGSESDPKTSSWKTRLQRYQRILP